MGSPIHVLERHGTLSSFDSCLGSGILARRNPVGQDCPTYS